MGSGMSRAFDEGATSGGVDNSELVEVSQQPEEQRDDTSPSLATSREEDRDDFLEEPPLEDPEHAPLELTVGVTNPNLVE
mmetsp:Transcript_7971/g.21970  ORF Transcript_7971/g.21970 Transcript_7971/m.21970 type:complete len:80 (+) Transcript_7971:1127-1366(+)